jgi:hypothetical protein
MEQGSRQHVTGFYHSGNKTKVEKAQFQGLSTVLLFDNSIS